MFPYAAASNIDTVAKWFSPKVNPAQSTSVKSRSETTSADIFLDVTGNCRHHETVFMAHTALPSVLTAYSNRIQFYKYSDTTTLFTETDWICIELYNTFWRNLFKLISVIG